MNFTAPAFVLLFPIVLALHWMLPPSRRWVLLLAASLGFYAVGSPQANSAAGGYHAGDLCGGTGHRKKQNTDGQKTLADLCGSFVHRVSVPLQICRDFPHRCAASAARGHLVLHISDPQLCH